MLTKPSCLVLVGVVGLAPACLNPDISGEAPLSLDVAAFDVAALVDGDAGTPIDAAEEDESEAPALPPLPQRPRARALEQAR